MHIQLEMAIEIIYIRNALCFEKRMKEYLLLLLIKFKIQSNKRIVPVVELVGLDCRTC